MMGFMFTLGVIALSAYVYLSSQRRTHTKSEISSVFDKNIKCPSCASALEMDKMLDAAVFYVPGAIVFDCMHCHDRIYFAPFDAHIEIGVLGCSPVVDPLPIGSFSYSEEANPVCKENDGILKVHMNTRTWCIPRYGLWNERTDIPKPADAGKTIASLTKTSVPA
jgi:hypothetical protein